MEIKQDRKYAEEFIGAMLLNWNDPEVVTGLMHHAYARYGRNIQFEDKRIQSLKTVFELSQQYNLNTSIKESVIKQSGNREYYDKLEEFDILVIPDLCNCLGVLTGLKPIAIVEMYQKLIDAEKTGGE